MRIIKTAVIGIICAIFRYVFQLIIFYSGNSLPPFSANLSSIGYSSLLFIIYCFTYCLMSVLFTFIKKNIYGNSATTGLKYGVFSSLIWITFRLEPLAHINIFCTVALAAAELSACILMGMLSGLLLTSKNENGNPKQVGNTWFKVLIITACFTNGRLVLYALDIYSSFNSSDVLTILWTVSTGVIIALYVLWIEKKLNLHKRMLQLLFTGGVVFGISMLFINISTLLMFNVSLWAYIIRTLTDIGTVTAGLLLLPESLPRQRTAFDKKYIL